MKKITLTLIIFAFCITAKATNCWYSFFLQERINIALCENNSRARESMYLYHKAMAIVLNEYIKEKIANGKLEDKRFEVHVTSTMLNPAHLELTQGRNGYFVSMSMADANLNNLRTIVHYFARLDWQPFIAEAHRSRKVNTRRVGNFFRQNAINEPFDFTPVTVWERDGVSLEFLADGFSYMMNGEPLPIPTNISHQPVRIGNRFLFFHDSGIHVMENGETIRVLEIDERRYGSRELTVDVYSKWVNISWGWGRDRLIYSYSYERNQFFRVRKEEGR